LNPFLTPSLAWHAKPTRRHWAVVVCLPLCCALATHPAVAADIAASADPFDPANPEAKVPLHRYRSVFTSAPTPVVPAAKPQDWAQANATVGQYTQGHADILRAEASQDGAPPSPTARPSPTQERP